MQKLYIMQFAHGIKVICTAHGNSMDGIKLNKNLKEMLELHFFEKIIFLSTHGKRGQIENIISIN